MSGMFSRSVKAKLAAVTFVTAMAMAFAGPSKLFAEDAAGGPDESLQHVKRDGALHVGMYLGFEGLSFKERGKLTGLEVEFTNLLSEQLSKDVGTPIKADIIDQEWSQIITGLRDKKFDVVISAVIPSKLYERSNITYSRAYLNTGPVIVTQKADGKPAKAVTEDVSSLEGKTVVVVNDPAVRKVLRAVGVYVPADEGKTDLETAFPKAATEAVLAKSGGSHPLIAVKEIRQLDDMPTVYGLIANGEVDAGVIDLGIVWWVANDSKRWSSRIFSFTKPVGPYIYSAVTRKEDAELGKAIDGAIEKVLQDPRYQDLLKRWHGGQVVDWKTSPTAFLE